MWFGFTYLAFFLCDTAASVPYYSLKYELCTDNVERTKIFMYTITASLIGLLIGTGLPGGLERLVGMDPDACVVVTMVHFVVIYAIGMWGAALFIAEPVEKARTKSFAASFTRVISTKAMRYFVGSETLEYAVIYVMAANINFFAYFEVHTLCWHSSTCIHCSAQSC